jgi:hypothetical protein
MATVCVLPKDLGKSDDTKERAVSGFYFLSLCLSEELRCRSKKLPKGWNLCTDNPTCMAMHTVYVHTSALFLNYVIHSGQSNLLVNADGDPCTCDAFVIEASDFLSIKTAGACRWTAPEIMNPPEDTLYADDCLALFTGRSNIYKVAIPMLRMFSSRYGRIITPNMH